LNTSDAILARLALEVDTVFGVYGGAIAELWDAFTRQDKLKYVCPMHEQSASFMAEGFSKVHGFGVAMSTSGPGGLNMVTGIANCFYDSTPCLFITGQVQTKFIKPSPEIRQLGFQETDIVSIVKPITKFAVTVLHPEHALNMLETAIIFAKEGRPGPSLIDLPVDVQRATC
jgi:acetolactate synthase-1/2/3 large subunit